MIYFLFGKEATDTFHLIEGLPEQQIAEQLKDIPHALFVWEDGMHPMQLLNEYDGWNDYLMITQTLYKLLKK